jgi:hypothetical protein
MTKQIVTVLGTVDEPIEKPFVLKWAKPQGAALDGTTNVFADTAAMHAGVAPESLPEGETVGTTGYPGETADTTWPL